MPRTVDPLDDWRPKGACFGSFNPVFFPESYGGREAQEICSSCEVRINCLEYARETHQLFGVWGGLTRSRRLKADRDAKESEKQAQDPVQSATA